MKIDDEYIVKLFYAKHGTGPLISQLRRKLDDSSSVIVSPDVDATIRKYVNNRYKDSKSTRETLFRIKHHIEYRPHCSTPGCVNDVEFNGTSKKPYMLHCCCSCTQTDKAVRDKQENRMLHKYGVRNAMHSAKIKQMQKQHLQEKYGDNITNVFQVPEVQEKIKQRLLANYGVDNIAKTQLCKEKHRLCEKETVLKRNATKRKNHTFNTSQLEENAYHLLVEHFGKDNVIRQYSSEKYPFNCDFYVKQYDLYVEFNGSWTHGSHPYDKSSKEDQDIIAKWKSKGTKYYDIAIHTWTVRDVNKRSIAKKNGVNIKEFWRISELKTFLEEFRNG